jgi:hypothetical protein
MSKIDKPADPAAPTEATASKPANSVETKAPTAAPTSPPKPAADTPRPKEIGGPKGPEPTRFGDWERDGRCVDF